MARVTYDHMIDLFLEILEPDLCVFVSLMQRRYSEPNTYTDSPPSDPYTCDDIYDDVASTENEQEVGETPLQCFCRKSIPFTLLQLCLF